MENYTRQDEIFVERQPRAPSNLARIMSKGKNEETLRAGGKLPAEKR